MTAPAYHLRPAERDDLEAAFALYVQVQEVHAAAEPAIFRPPQNDELFARTFNGWLDDPGQHMVFACRDGRPVGFVEYFLGLRPETAFVRESPIAVINALVVDERHRGQGCGTRLIEHVKEAARAADIALLGIDVWSFNGPARACFAKAGFRAGREFLWQNL